ncbi:1,4-dihydroxy-2-naphthoyl-CoA synthase [Psychroflexus sediminis]|uniref:1,4-dihydroxy-2-naphthoyl-CoA synthase n=1 Tax=Psychroflexus sediminis TaxID=470826 RepID=A0A1G7WQ22_9FLAO|nr:1,4-dihydroxy-2-naphthoyl-CoA synthase [Psychroflexus sediminis]SDG73330.1 1,4-Dihydroxy-2-naphthoyl-CoA synthase [Psychroflexus sediminis]
MNWKTVKEYTDITYQKSNGVARIAFNRPEVRNAFRPKTVGELFEAFLDAREDPNIGVVLFSGEGPSPKDGKYAFCSGGDQNARGHQGYVDEDGTPRLNILEVQRLIRFMPKVVIAVVPGWAVGGGHSLHVVCDLTLASKEHAIFKQTDADVTSFDGGYGSAYLAKMVGQKKAREIFFLGRNYSAQEAFEMGMVNAVIPHDELESTAYDWAQEILEKSPTSIKMLKFAFNATDDGMVGQQVFAGEATRLAYMTEEAKEGRNAFLEKRKPNFKNIKWIS